MNLWQTALLFLVYSFIGWVGESLYKTEKKKHFINSGFLNGPLCPIYGFGGFIMILLVKIFEAYLPNIVTSNSIISLAAIFVISFVILSIWEYVVAVLLEAIFHVKYWDYSNRFLNIHGRVCLNNSVYWGICGFIFTKLFDPWQQKFLLPAIKSIPHDSLIVLDIVLYSVLTIDIIKNVLSVAWLKKTIDKVKKLSDAIKARSEELEFHPTEAAKEFAGDKIHRLKIRETRLRLRLSMYSSRMKKAFPTMKNEVLSKIDAPDFDKYKLKKYLAELKFKRRRRIKNKGE